MTDNDLIRRKDALNAVQLGDTVMKMQARIAALPAVTDLDKAHRTIAARDRRIALARRGAAAQWRPIETAPKDGTHFLAVLKNEQAIRMVAWCKTSHVPLWGWNLVDQGAEDVDFCDPTHWMPLPDPPKGESDE